MGDAMYVQDVPGAALRHAFDWWEVGEVGDLREVGILVGGGHGCC